MRRALIAVPLVLAIAPAAQAAQVQTSRGCYLQQRAVPPTVAVEGSAFAPDTPYSVLLDGTPVPTGVVTTGNDGRMSGSFSPPGLAATESERTFQLSVQAGADTATTSFTVTRLAADFKPRNGLVRKLRVRFSVYGMGLGANPNPDVYVHWITPRGKLRATAFVGRAQGACGSLPTTSRRRLFPFARTQKGLWRLQFDTRRKFRRGRAGANFLFYSIGVRVT